MESTARITPTSFPSRRILGPVVALVALLAFTVFYLHSQGRYWICTCGTVKLWAGDIWDYMENSQHLLDPYSLSHIEHGLLFYWLMFGVLPRLRMAWGFVAAMTLESTWEMVENSQVLIQRYQETTISEGYTGDTIVNSMGDLATCAFGFWIAHLLGFRRTLLLIIAIEVGMMLWIRDSMLINIIMLFFPLDAIRTWQMGM